MLESLQTKLPSHIQILDASESWDIFASNLKTSNQEGTVTFHILKDFFAYRAGQLKRELNHLKIWSSNGCKVEHWWLTELIPLDIWY